MMDTVLQYISLGVVSVFFDADGALWLTPSLMVIAGVVIGILVGATPGLSGPFAMAIATPVLISIFGYSNAALYPVLGCLLGIMKGATLGGAVPAILFNTPGTPDAFLTTLDGHPMARKGYGLKAIQTAHFSSVMGDNLSDLALFIAAPTFAVAVERVLGLPEKGALIFLSLCFMAAVVGDSPLKGLIGGLLGMLLSLVGSTLSGAGPRLTLGIPELGGGLPLTSAVLGVLILSEVLVSIETMRHESRAAVAPIGPAGDGAAPDVGREAADDARDSAGWRDRDGYRRAAGYRHDDGRHPFLRHGEAPLENPGSLWNRRPRGHHRVGIREFGRVGSQT